ncbi:DNA adenine methylase [Wolbachia endosymbiont (group A) of Anomoia purmunda]|uniref:DNA adenine methylase n=1 Tax=Wolbachia endosymbiont (group A) of Anomoia purmunda TaxID=2953978 RepID=UPI003877A257
MFCIKSFIFQWHNIVWGYVSRRFTPSSIERLAKFSIKNLTVDLADFKKSIPKHANDFLYCDPPYLIDQKLYGKRGKDFDHEETFVDSR